MLHTLPAADQARLQRIAEHLHRLGPRATAEALADALLHGDLDRLAAFQRVTPAALDTVLDRQFPPRVVAVSGRG